MEANKIIYVVGARSASKHTIGRKVREIIGCWQGVGHEVFPIFGGDVPIRASAKDSSVTSSYGDEAHFNQSFRRSMLLQPIVHSVSEMRDMRHNLVLSLEVAALAQKVRPDLVWERSCRLHCAGLVLARSLGVPYVLEWKDHLIDYETSLFRRRALAMEARKNKEADYIVVESEVLREALGRDGIDTAKILVAHNAVHTSEFKRDMELGRKVRGDLGVGEDAVLVGYLGSYAFYHDAIRLVLASKLLRGDPRGSTTKVLMMGAGRDAELCRKMAQELGLLDNCIIMRPGVPQREVPGVLSALDVAVLPGSTDIICPIKVQEYMASELPSVVPDYPCNREIVTHGVNGLLFKPGDESALAEAILMLASQPDLRLRIGRAGREAAEQMYNWEATWGAALQTVLEREEIRHRQLTSTAGVNQ